MRSPVCAKYLPYGLSTWDKFVLTSRFHFNFRGQFCYVIQLKWLTYDRPTMILCWLSNDLVHSLNVFIVTSEKFHQPILTLWTSGRLHTDILASGTQLFSTNNFKLAQHISLNNIVLSSLLFEISMQYWLYDNFDAVQNECLHIAYWIHIDCDYSSLNEFSYMS